MGAKSPTLERPSSEGGATPRTPLSDARCDVRQRTTPRDLRPWLAATGQPARSAILCRERRFDKVRITIRRGYLDDDKGGLWRILEDMKKRRIVDNSNDVHVFN